MTQVDTEIRAVLTRRGDVYILACDDGGRVLTLAASREMMVVAASEIAAAARRCARWDKEVCLVFPEHNLTVSARYAATLAEYMQLELDVLSVTLNPQRN